MARFGMLAVALVGAACWSSVAGAETTAASKDPNAGPGGCAKMKCAHGCVNNADGTGTCTAAQKKTPGAGFLCKLKKCKWGCDDTTGKCKPESIQIHLAKCDPACADTERCAWKQVQCVKAPCPPIAACVAKKDSESCETTKCATGQTCILLLSNPPKASCIDSSSLPK